MGFAATAMKQHGTYTPVERKERPGGKKRKRKECRKQGEIGNSQDIVPV